MSSGMPTARRLHSGAPSGRTGTMVRVLGKRNLGFSTTRSTVADVESSTVSALARGCSVSVGASSRSVFIVSPLSDLRPTVRKLYHAAGTQGHPAFPLVVGPENDGKELLSLRVVPLDLLRRC